MGAIDVGGGGKVERLRRFVAALVGIGLALNGGASAQQAAAPPASPPAVLLNASTVIGSNVKDASGRDVGKVEELMLDPGDGRVAFAVVSFGGFLGLGSKLFAVPWEALTVSRGESALVLHVRQDMLGSAPSFERGRRPEASSREWGEAARRFWADATITAAVKRRLAGEHMATLVKINVDTNQGTVHLNGTVDSPAAKERAAELARQVEGVRQVVNNLKVQGSS
jgi:osmotically-inducible protein OsmY